MEKPLAANPEDQQLPLAFQSVTAFRPGAKRVLGSNLSVRSPSVCQSRTAPPGARWHRCHQTGCSRRSYPPSMHLEDQHQSDPQACSSLAPGPVSSHLKQP